MFVDPTDRLFSSFFLPAPLLPSSNSSKRLSFLWLFSIRGRSETEDRQRPRERALAARRRQVPHDVMQAVLWFRRRTSNFLCDPQHFTIVDGQYNLLGVGTSLLLSSAGFFLALSIVIGDTCLQPRHCARRPPSAVSSSVAYTQAHA